MSYKSPLGQLPVKRRKYTECTKSIIPETIRLPDGREFGVKELLNQPRNRRSYNLQTGRESGLRTPRKIAKPVDTNDKE